MDWFYWAQDHSKTASVLISFIKKNWDRVIFLGYSTETVEDWTGSREPEYHWPPAALYLCPTAPVLWVASIAQVTIAGVWTAKQTEWTTLEQSHYCNKGFTCTLHHGDGMGVGLKPQIRPTNCYPVVIFKHKKAPFMIQSTQGKICFTCLLK